MTRQDTATRDNLLDAAECLFAERGFARASVGAIIPSRAVNARKNSMSFGRPLRSFE